MLVYDAVIRQPSLLPAIVSRRTTRRVRPVANKNFWRGPCSEKQQGSTVVQYSCSARFKQATDLALTVSRRKVTEQRRSQCRVV